MTATRGVLITGAAGFIGSNVALSMLDAGSTVITLDNYCNSDPDVIDQLREIGGNRVVEYAGDVRDRALVEKILRTHSPDCVIHLAGLKSVEESRNDPLSYYAHNVSGTIILLQAMAATGVRRLVFSSSATIYADESVPPFGEGSRTEPGSVYGRTKHCCEQILGAIADADPTFSAVSLRYFNPLGSDASGTFGDAPRGRPNNLMPYLHKVATGELPYLTIHGNDYPTEDGTGVRDFVHVSDVANGHRLAVEFTRGAVGHHAFNLGSGVGYSVLQVVSMFARQSGRDIAWRLGKRRPGDRAVSIANTEMARHVLGWHARRDLADMCKDAWNFMSKRATASTIT